MSSPLRVPVVALVLACVPLAAQERPVLTVSQIMQDPKTWVGAWPSDVFWTDGGGPYFWWNPQGRFPSDSLFTLDAQGQPVAVDAAARRLLPPRFGGWHADRLAYDPAFARRVFVRDGDVWLYDLAGRSQRRLTQARPPASEARFAPGGQHVVYQRDGHLWAHTLDGGAIRQLTDLRPGAAPPATPTYSPADSLLRAQQRRLFDVLRRQQAVADTAQAWRAREDRAHARPTPIYTGTQTVTQLRIDPTERFVSFVLADRIERRETQFMDYVTASGYAEARTARPKVGEVPVRPVLHLQDRQRDTVYTVDLRTLPGAFDPPDYRRAQGVAADSHRVLWPYGPFWSADGAYAVVVVRSADHKDRWIARLDPVQGTLTSLDRQRDEAWIAGPGIPWWAGGEDIGWLPDHRRIWFQSERTGFSHLYIADVPTGTVQALTDGRFEIFDPVVSRDGQTWFFTSSEGSPYERHFYRMPVGGGPRERLTQAVGFHAVAVAPDDRRLANLFSMGNAPPEVFVGALPGRRQRPPVVFTPVTQSTTSAWRAYPWENPEIIELPASDGAQVPARIYRPTQPNGAAVLFVHGAGYLQNVHRGWSPYHREYFFHHLLRDRGYLVLDLDFRASAGYGRDWRTAIYRHMGGRDLQDYVDASRWLGTAHGIDPERVFLYGGSYGGFLTLMALFTAPQHFGGGAANRAVTDWVHYNHGYTAAILNTPTEDPDAFARSSPIEFAHGLEDPLLMAHGLLDDNVQPQDIFRLSQRLIELGKTDWELALHPVEPHGYLEPTSWTDQYTRILHLIERTVGAR